MRFFKTPENAAPADGSLAEIAFGALPPDPKESAPQAGRLTVPSKRGAFSVLTPLRTAPDYPARRIEIPAAFASAAALSVFSQLKLPSLPGSRPKWPWRAVCL